MRASKKKEKTEKEEKTHMYHIRTFVILLPVLLLTPSTYNIILLYTLFLSLTHTLSLSPAA
jgi:hypothetical protein